MDCINRVSLLVANTVNSLVESLFLKLLKNLGILTMQYTQVNF